MFSRPPRFPRRFWGVATSLAVSCAAAPRPALAEDGDAAVTAAPKDAAVEDGEPSEEDDDRADLADEGTDSASADETDDDGGTPDEEPAPTAQPRTINVYAAGTSPDDLKRASGAGTVIGARDIRNAQPQSAGEMLRRVPGLSVRTEDPTGLRLNVGVRGLSPSRSRLVLVEEDGVPVVVSPYGEPELYYMTSVERVLGIRVIKGVDVLAQGPQTVGAAIQLHTWDPTPSPSWKVSTTLGTRRFAETLARYSDTSGDVGYVVQLFNKGGAGYRNMGFHVSDGFGKVRFPTGRDGTLTVKLAFHDELANTTYTGLTDALYQQDPRRPTIAPDDHFGIRRYEASLHHEQHFGLQTVLESTLFGYHMDLDLRLQDFDRARLPQIDYDRVADPTELFFRKTSSLRDRTYDVAGLSFALRHRFHTGSLRHKVTVGARGMVDNARRKLSRGSFPRAQSGDLITDDTTLIFGTAAWAADQIAFTDYLLVTPAFRIEHADSAKTTHRIADDATAPRDVDITGASHSTGLMPGLGLVLGSKELNAFSSAYLGYSAPRVSQAITPDGQDANLKAEHSTNFELGVRGRLGSWLVAEADGFMINFDNQLVSNNPLSGATSEFVNGGRTRHLGAEATATARFGRAFDLPVDVDFGGHYTFIRSRFVGGTFDGNTVPYSPNNMATATLDLAHDIGLSGQAAFTYTGAQYSDERNTVEQGPTGLDGRIDPYTTLSFALRYRNPATGLGVSASLKNALDRVYISSRLPNGIFTSGFRQFFMSFSWTSPD